MWLLAGKVRMFHVWGVTVYAHAALIVLAALLLLFSLGGGGLFGGFGNTALFLATLLVIIVLHEFGHIWGARATGGHAEEVVLTPLGGLALAQPARGWYSHTITIICGPLVNVLICIVCAIILGTVYDYLPLGPFSVGEGYRVGGSAAGRVIYYVYATSYFLLLFNLLPIWPLDGGQLLQGLLWWKVGWYKATLWATTIGLVGAVLLTLYGIASGALLMVFIAITCGLNCFQLRRQLVAHGPWAFQEQEEPDWKRSLSINPDQPKKPGVFERNRQARAAKKAEREAAEEQRLRDDVDRILEKIHREGMNSLSSGEKKTLEKARSLK